MRKLLLCLVIGLSAAMLFAVDITTALETGGGSWTSAPAGDGGGSDLTVKFNAKNVEYVKVGFSGSPVTEATTTVDDVKDVELTDQNDTTGKISMASSKAVYVYYAVKTQDKITISLEAQSMATTSQEEGAPTGKIPFYIESGSTKITSTDALSGSGSAKTVLTYDPSLESPKPVESAQLDIYTMINDIPVDVSGEYSGIVRMYVTAEGVDAGV